MKRSSLAASAGLLVLMACATVSNAAVTCKWVPNMCPGNGGGDTPSSLPEPATLGLLGAGLGALGLAVYRRRRNRD